jgi:hypothetical protein
VSIRTRPERYDLVDIEYCVNRRSIMSVPEHFDADEFWHG